MTGGGKALAAAVMVMCTLALVPGAWAQDESQESRASALVAEAQSHEKQGAFLQAAESYRAAYRLIPHPILLHNLGQAYRRAGEPARAYHFFLMYLAIESEGDIAELARSLSDELRESISDEEAKTPPEDDILRPAVSDEPAEETSEVEIAPVVRSPIVAEPQPLAGRQMSTSTWVLGGAGLIGLGIGGYLSTSAWLDLQDCESAGVCASDAEVDTIRTRMRVGDSVILLSSAALLGAGLLYLWSGEERQGGSAISLAPTPVGATLTWGAHF